MNNTISSINIVRNSNYDINKDVTKETTPKVNSELYFNDSLERRQASFLLDSEKPEYIEAETVSL